MSRRAAKVAPKKKQRKPRSKRLKEEASSGLGVLCRESGSGMGNSWVLRGARRRTYSVARNTRWSDLGRTLSIKLQQRFRETGRCFSTDLCSVQNAAARGLWRCKVRLVVTRSSGLGEVTRLPSFVFLGKLCAPSRPLGFSLVSLRWLLFTVVQSRIPLKI